MSRLDFVGAHVSTYSLRPHVAVDVLGQRCRWVRDILGRRGTQQVKVALHGSNEHRIAVDVTISRGGVWTDIGVRRSAICVSADLNTASRHDVRIDDVIREREGDQDRATSNSCVYRRWSYVR